MSVPGSNFSDFVTVSVSPTYISTDLITPGRSHRETLPAIGCRQLRKSDPLLWGKETLPCSTGSLAYHHFKKSYITPEPTVFVSHRHFGTRILTTYTKSQPYTLTSLRLSRCRLNDQRLPSPFQSDLIEKWRIDDVNSGQAHDSYFSHCCKFQVFPMMPVESAEHENVHERKPQTFIRDATRRALQRIRKGLYDTTTYQSDYSGHKDNHGLDTRDRLHPHSEMHQVVCAEELRNDGVVDASKTQGIACKCHAHQTHANHMERTRLDPQVEEKTICQVCLCPLMAAVVPDDRNKWRDQTRTSSQSEETMASQAKLETKRLDFGPSEMCASLDDEPCVPLSKTKAENAEQAEQAQINAISAEANQLGSADDIQVPWSLYGRELGGQVGLSRLTPHGILKRKCKQEQTLANRAEGMTEKKIKYYRGFRTDAHHDFHLAHTEKLPDLRESCRQGRKHSFCGFNVCVLR